MHDCTVCRTNRPAHHSRLSPPHLLSPRDYPLRTTRTATTLAKATATAATAATAAPTPLFLAFTITACGAYQAPVICRRLSLILVPSPSAACMTRPVPSSFGGFSYQSMQICDRLLSAGLFMNCCNNSLVSARFGSSLKSPGALNALGDADMRVRSF